MNKFTRILVISAVAAAIGGASLYLGSSELLYREAIENGKIDILYIRKAISQYVQDDSSHRFPAAFQDLLSRNYLNQGDLSDLHNAGKIVYFSPPNGASKDFIILEGHADQFILRCPLEGSVSVSRIR